MNGYVNLPEEIALGIINNSDVSDKRFVYKGAFYELLKLAKVNKPLYVHAETPYYTVSAVANIMTQSQDGVYDLVGLKFAFLEGSLMAYCSIAEVNTIYISIEGA